MVHCSNKTGQLYILCSDWQRGSPQYSPLGRVSLQNKILEFRLLLCTKVKPWPRQFFSGFFGFGSPYPHVIKDFHCIPIWSYIWLYIAGISDDAEMKDPEVGKSWIFFHKLSRPRVITGPKEKFEFEKKKHFGHIAIKRKSMTAQGWRIPKSNKSEKKFELFRPRVNFGGKQKGLAFSIGYPLFKLPYSF